MTTLQSELSWFFGQRLKDYERAEICQCGTEAVISRSTMPTRMRTVLLSLFFIDQFVYTHYNGVHPTFRREYPIPKLNQHSFHTHASPSWLVYPRHKFDQEADWTLTIATFRDCLKDLASWLEDQLGAEPTEFWDLVRLEIAHEFENEHQRCLLQVVEEVRA